MKIKSLFLKTFLGLGIGLLFCFPILAAGPNEIAYQGKLTNSSGDPVSNGSYKLWFAVTDEGGTPLAPELAVTVSVQNGVFSTTIPFSPDLFQGTNSRFLRVRRDGVSTPFGPPQKLVAAPYALGIADGSVGMAEINSSILNANNGLLKLDASGKVPDAQLNTTVTKLGNTVNAVNGLLRLDPSGKVPDGLLNLVTNDRISGDTVAKDKLKQADLGLLYEAADGRLLKSSGYTSALCDLTIETDADGKVTGVNSKYKNCSSGECTENLAQSCTGIAVGRMISLP